MSAQSIKIYYSENISTVKLNRDKASVPLEVVYYLNEHRKWKERSLARVIFLFFN